MRDRAELSFSTVVDVFGEFWERYGSKLRSHPIDGNDIVFVLRAAIEWGEYDLFEEAYMSHGELLPTPFFFFFFF